MFENIRIYIKHFVSIKLSLRMSATVYLIKTAVHFTCSGLNSLSALKTVGDRHIFGVHRSLVLFELLEH